MTILLSIFFIILHFENSSFVIPVSMIICHIAVAVVIHLLLSVGVYYDAKSKQLEEYKSYAILPACFDVLGLAVYLFFTRDIKRNADKKKAISLIISGMIIFLINIMLFSFISCPTGKTLDRNYYKYLVTTYKNENGENVLYDKMGNEYTLNKARYLALYDKDGNSYSVLQISHSDDGMEYHVIDKDGYLEVFDNLGLYYNERYKFRIMYDEKGNLYYDYDNCYWNENGELFFSPKIIGKYTYEKIMESTKKENVNLKFCFRNDEGIYVFYDKMGKEYSTFDYDFYDAYGRDGTVYHPYYDEKEYNYKFKTDKSNKSINGVIDRDGYLVPIESDFDFTPYNPDNSLFDTDYFIWHDSKGNIYYDYFDCHWDKDGTLLIDDELANATYEDVVKAW